MADIHKPGETVKTSGIYKVIKEGEGANAFEVEFAVLLSDKPRGTTADITDHAAVYWDGTRPALVQIGVVVENVKFDRIAY
jgi:hypothetical protein